MRWRWVPWVIVALAGGLTAHSLAQQSGQPAPGEIGTTTPVALGVVVTLLAGAVGYGMRSQTIRDHVDNEEIHVKKSEMLETFRRAASCEKIHERLEKQLDRLDGLLDRGGR